jgi:hypothetical protein
MPPPWVFVRAVLIWLLIATAESAQGALRRVLFDPDAEFAVRQASVVFGAVTIFLIAWFSMRWMHVRTGAGALAVGALWVALTLAFEILLGQAMGLSRARLLSDYDLLHGGLMPLGLAAMALTPWLVRRLRTRSRVAPVPRPRTSTAQAKRP